MWIRHAHLHLLVVGTLLISAGYRASAQIPPLPQVRGTVASIAANHTCFDLTDRNGNRVTIQLHKQTQFYINYVNVTLADALFIGDDVQVTLNTDNVAVAVTNRNRARAAAADLRADLECTDDEWQALAPLLTNVLQAQRLVDAQGRSDLRTALDDLDTTLQNPHAMNSDISFKVRTLRALHAKAKTALQKAQQDLIPLLTPRQEGTLVSLGILD
jgi:predicted RNA binding protein with dsRBD fold (UPF0201 family)